MNHLNLSAKNLVTIGVFSAVYFVIMFAGGMMGIMGPQFILVGALLAGFINAIVMMLYLVRAKTVGALTITGLLCGLLMVLTGHSWFAILFGTLFGFIGDQVAASGDFVNRSRNILGYAVFTLWGISPMMPIFINSEAYFADVAQQMNSVEYAQQMAAIFTPTSILVITAVTFLLSCVGGYVGTKVLDKHFVKAGMA